ncbi:ketosteroid isomerase-like protein [Methylophaga lonarensis MPL]|uniref:Ketosteroid isomerase-like protein n=2 Tax=Methylophaga lonarensis TaxID=999151 RepID=M7PR22_9GAMM|nr:ketosteroid isomerase-like protein [Methylophaga lonarensis]EMR12889.1 ketosteroid isomerase-like protein [Methylophaga lonarensis MPL]
MKTLSYLMLCGCMFVTDDLVIAETLDDKQRIENAFSGWAQGTASPFELLADTTQWTVMGPSPSAGTYSLAILQQAIIKPFNQRLATPLTPLWHEVYQAGDEIIILFEAEAMLINGERYQNSYAWFFTMQHGKVSRVRAVLDLHAFDRVMAIELEDK